MGPVLRWSGKYYMGFVKYLILFPKVQKLWKLVHNFDKVITDYIMSFMDHRV